MKLVTPDQILALAEELAARGDEVSLRSAASRAYYATHHALLPHVRGLPVVKVSPFPGRVGHQELVRRLELWKHPNSKLHCKKYPAIRFSRFVRAMIAVREQADYHLHAPFESRQVELQLIRTRAAIEFAKECDEIIASAA